MKYYYDLLSQPSRAIYIFLTKNKIPFEKCPVYILRGQHKSPEYQKVNPLKLVPALDDDGFKLTESIAIFRYLVRKHEDIPAHWYPVDPQQRAIVDQYLCWHHLNTRLNCVLYFQYKWMFPLFKLLPPDEKKVSFFQKRMEKTLDDFENLWLKDTPFLAGDTSTFADLLAFCELQQPAVAGYDVLKNRPVLGAWYKRVEMELQPEVSEASGSLNGLITLYPLSAGLFSIFRLLQNMGLRRK